MLLFWDAIFWWPAFLSLFSCLVFAWFFKDFEWLIGITRYRHTNERTSFIIMIFGNYVLKLFLQYFEVMLNIFEFSRVWENTESWLVYVNNLFWIAQPCFSNNIRKQSYSKLLFLAFRTFNRCNLSELKKSNSFIYVAIGKHCWIIRLGELNSDQKYLCQINQEILKASKNNCNCLKAFQLMCPYLARNCWRISTGCFIYNFVIQVISEKTLCSKGFASNLRDIFAWK